MFGWFKKRLLTRMLGLTDVAQLMTFTALIDHYSLDSRMSENQCAAKAAAVANCFFGKSPDPRHVQQFNFVTLQTEAAGWLKANEPFRELVVQSLRVLNTAAHESSPTGPVIGESILVVFGSDYPDEPNPETYEELVHRVLGLLPLKSQENIRSWRKRSGR